MISNFTTSTFLLLSSLVLLACRQANEKKFEESYKFLDKHVYYYVKHGPSEKIDTGITRIYPHINTNKYLAIMYYVLRTKRGVFFNQLNQALLYADSAEVLYSSASPRLKEELLPEYLDFLIHKGNILFAQKKYIVAYDTFYKVLQVLKTSPYRDMENLVYHTMGMNSYKQKVYDKAVEYFKNELRAIDRTPNKYLQPNLRFFRRQQALSNIALSYTKLNIPDSASTYFTYALHYIDNNNKGNCNSDQYNACRAVILGNMAKLFVFKNLPDSAIAYYKKSIYLTLYRPLSNRLSNRDVKDGGLSLIQLADIYHSRGDTINFRKTVLELNKWYDSDINYIFNHDEYRLGYLRLNAAYFDDVGDDRKAYLYLKEYSDARDSIAKLDAISKERNLAVALEIKSREDEVKNLTLANRLNRIFIWSAVIIAILVAVVAILFFKSGQKSKRNNLLLQKLNNEIKQQQKETQFAFEQMEIANKEKDRILMIVAHDLRNPLSGISALADLILQEKNYETIWENVGAISRASKRSNKMVNELLSSVDRKLSSVEMGRIQVNKLLDDLLLMFSFEAKEKNIRLVLHHAARDVYIIGDASKLERVIGNVLHNAIKFSKTNTTVTLRLEVNNGKAKIFIKDTGIGMNEKVIESLYNANAVFTREGTGGEKGYGMGWSICQQIIRSHKGNLAVSSKENFGTTITIELDALTSNS